MPDCPSAAHGTSADPYGCYERERAVERRIDRAVEALDPAIYSDQRALVSPGPGEPSEWVRITWRQLAEERRVEIERLRGFESLVLDLDRNENGRHEGDADVGHPSGVSQGNPRFGTGDVIGYDISGRPYVMPERGKRHDPAAWGAR